jgi:hypothetical protein
MRANLDNYQRMSSVLLTVRRSVCLHLSRLIHWDLAVIAVIATGSIVVHLSKFVWGQRRYQRCFLVLIKTQFWRDRTSSLKVGYISFNPTFSFPRPRIEKKSEEPDAEAGVLIHWPRELCFGYFGGQLQNNHHTKNSHIESLDMNKVWYIQTADDSSS